MAHDRPSLHKIIDNLALLVIHDCGGLATEVVSCGGAFPREKLGVGGVGGFASSLIATLLVRGCVDDGIR